MESRFNPQWQPALLEEEVLATGSWWYQEVARYDVILLRQRFDYSSEDLEEIEQGVDYETRDYIEWDINQDGEVFFWVIRGPSTQTRSPGFGSFQGAKDHIETYAGRKDIHWHNSA